jgi:DNA-binding MarR family transcriptional regulator
MSTRKHRILNKDASHSTNRSQLLDRLDRAIEDNGNTNVLLVHAIAQHVGLSAAEFECCSLIQEQGPFTAGELAKRCHITTGGMTGMIDRLERRGFVTREADPNDRRRVLVRAVNNEAAYREVRELYGPLQVSFNELIHTYNDQELEFIANFMDKVNAMFHKAIDSLPEKHTSEQE